MVLLSLQILSLAGGAYGFSRICRLHRNGDNPPKGFACLFLLGMQLVALSYLFRQLHLLTGREEWFPTTIVVHGVGALTLIVVAPLFYHGALRRSISRFGRYIYAVADLLILLLIGGLFWERYRGVAVIVVNLLFALALLYGVLLGAERYRLLDRPQRRGVLVFALLLVGLLTPVYVGESVAAAAPFIWERWYDGVGVPFFSCAVSLLLPGFLKEEPRSPGDAANPTPREL